jgi:hypothetical protein
MRLTTDFWVSALVRRVFKDGGFAAVLQRGSDSAGAVFIVLRDRFGTVSLFGPAPQTGYDGARPDDRIFVLLMQTDDQGKIDEKLARERRFDPDLWLVEIEPAGAQSALFPVMTP